MSTQEYARYGCQRNGRNDRPPLKVAFIVGNKDLSAKPSVCTHNSAMHSSTIEDKQTVKESMQTKETQIALYAIFVGRTVQSPSKIAPKRNHSRTGIVGIGEQ
uniref:Uncharacterized protein n=1 Tax=Heterorhabditis bacteriophora TaxID=37862 RepID=A0A1I7XVS5_HETBA